MRAARLSHQVTLQKNENVTDPRSGQKQQQWVDVATVWAGIEPLRGRELIAAQQVNSEVTTRIVMRWAADLLIDHSMMVLFVDLQGAEHRYDILHDPINPNMVNREIQLLCKEVR